MSLKSKAKGGAWNLIGAIAWCTNSSLEQEPCSMLQAGVAHVEWSMNRIEGLAG